MKRALLRVLRDIIRSTGFDAIYEPRWLRDQRRDEWCQRIIQSVRRQSQQV